MLGRRSDVYSSSACFVSSIACKRQTSPHPNVEKEKDETKREEEKRREMIFTTYIHFKIHGRRRRRWYEARVCKDMRGKCWERGSPLLSCSHSRALAIDVMTCYSSRQSRIHTCTSSDTHSLTQHSFDASPARPRARHPAVQQLTQLLLSPFESCLLPRLLDNLSIASALLRKVQRNMMSYSTHLG